MYVITHPTFDGIVARQPDARASQNVPKCPASKQSRTSKHVRSQHLRLPARQPWDTVAPAGVPYDNQQRMRIFYFIAALLLSIQFLSAASVSSVVVNFDDGSQQRVDASSAQPADDSIPATA